MISIGAVSYPQEEIEYSNSEMKLKINNSEFQDGELIITKSEIAWKKCDADSQGFTIPWDKIVVQAISSEHERSIYFMIDCLWPESNQQSSQNGNARNGNDSHQEAENEAVEDGDEEDVSDEYIDCDDEESEITEFWLVPNNRDEIDNIYYLMTRHPERENMEESEEDDDDNFLDGEDIEQMNINDERFADD